MEVSMSTHQVLTVVLIISLLFSNSAVTPALALSPHPEGTPSGTLAATTGASETAAARSPLRANPAFNVGLPTALTLDAAITISSTGFYPAQVTVNSGEVVIWINQTAQPQRVIGKTYHINLPFVVRNFGGTLASESQRVGERLQTIQTGDDDNWDSGLIAPGSTYTRTFTTPGFHAFHLSGQEQFAGFIQVIEAPDYSLSIQPTSRAVLQGATATYTVTVNAQAGFTDTVALSVSGLPANAIATWSQNPVSPTASVMLSVTTALNTLTGVFTPTVNGLGGGFSHSLNFTLSVQSAIAPDFQIGVLPSTQSVTQSLAISYTVLDFGK
jgi:plastocyanin